MLAECLLWFGAVFQDLKNVYACVYIPVLYLFIWANKNQQNEKTTCYEAWYFVN